MVTGVVAGLAGCSGFGSSSSESSDEVPGTSGPNTRTDPEAHLIRIDTDRPPVWLEATGGGDGGRPTRSDRNRHTDHHVIDSESRSDRLTVADGVDRDALDDFRNATSFDSETLYLETQQVEECFRLDLCQISWGKQEVTTDYGRLVRPYDERCAVDEYVFEARLIRIPDAIEADRVNSYGSGVGRGACGERRARGESMSGSATQPTATPESTDQPGSNTTTSEGEQ